MMRKQNAEVRIQNAEFVAWGIRILSTDYLQFANLYFRHLAS